MQRVKKIGYVVALVFAASAMSGISAAAPQPQDTPTPQETPPPHQDMPQRKDMPQPKDEAQPSDQTTKDQKDQSKEVMAEKMSTTATVMVSRGAWSPWLSTCPSARTQNANVASSSPIRTCPARSRQKVRSTRGEN